ncbi:MAG: type IV secretory system conjugative DNA transfer family protein [Aurantimonas endophytica]|uniref:type IV secretory system conjugative DNA transfer family protein n=1 Tax=Aurantimonas endophytica TaxID=1522175 RepID=UPI0030023990
MLQKDSSTLADVTRFGVVAVIVAIPTLLLGFLLMEFAVHGLKVDAWPPEAVPPGAWFDLIITLRFGAVIRELFLMAAGSHPGFPGGGFWPAVLLFGLWFSTTLVFAMPRKDPSWRDPNTLFGAARLAHPAETATMQKGFEIGYAGGKQNPLRVDVEGNLLSIAPPRSGKTSGLIINNLLAPDSDRSWQGPAVVIDPKGEVYAAVGDRRRALGRDVYVIDLRQDRRGSTLWNPMDTLRASDTLGLMRVARALIPEMTGESMYFRERAVSLLAGIFAVALLDAQKEGVPATPGDAEALLNDEAEALSSAAAYPKNALIRALHADLCLDERIRGSIISTAKLGIQWLLDEYLRELTSKAELNIEAVARGNADLFVIVPTEHFQTMAPLLRWLLSDLFTAVRRSRRPDDLRLTLFIDEAASLGCFDQLSVALGELPGLGLSIWTFWQSRAQIAKHYGDAGADIFGATAEFSTFSDIGGLETSSADFFSRLLGETTVDVPGESQQRQGNQMTTGQSAGKQATRLVPPGDIPAFTANKLVLIPNSRRYPKRPIQLEKIRYFEEKRFEGLFRDVPPAGLSS